MGSIGNMGNIGPRRGWRAIATAESYNITAGCFPFDITALYVLDCAKLSCYIFR